MTGAALAVEGVGGAGPGPPATLAPAVLSFRSLAGGGVGAPPLGGVGVGSAFSLLLEEEASVLVAPSLCREKSCIY